LLSVLFCFVFSVLELSCPLHEKVHAFTGMLSILHKNPEVLLGNKTNIYSFLVACYSWSEPPPNDIRSGLREILVAVRNHNPQMWNKVFTKFGLSYATDSIVEMYQLH
jgi:hypothetical protein